MLGRKYWLCLPCVTGDFLVSLAVSFLICHWGLWWEQLLQAGPDPANSWDRQKFSCVGDQQDWICSQLLSCTEDLVVQVLINWREKWCHQMVFFFFLRNPGMGCCSGADIQKLGFKLNFLLAVAVDCVNATGLITTLDPSEGPQKCCSLSYIWRQKDCAQQHETTAEKNREFLLASAQSLQWLVWRLSAGDSSQKTAVRRTGVLRTFQGRDAEWLFA